MHSKKKKKKEDKQPFLEPPPDDDKVVLEGEETMVMEGLDSISTDLDKRPSTIQDSRGKASTKSKTQNLDASTSSDTTGGMEDCSMSRTRVSIDTRFAGAVPKVTLYGSNLGKSNSKSLENLLHGSSILEGASNDPLLFEQFGNKMDVGNQLAAVRTELANERTLLAWIRTGASLVGCGMTVSNWHRKQQVVGIGFMCAGFFTCFQGVIRYYQMRKRLNTFLDNFLVKQNAGRLGMRWFSSVIALIMVSCLVAIVIEIVKGHDDNESNDPPVGSVDWWYFIIR